MSAPLLLAVIATVASVGCGQWQKPAEDSRLPESAGLAWQAFYCAKYSVLAGKPDTESERLRNVGMVNGRRFLEALDEGKISDAEVREKVPLSVLASLQGPTNDFILGRLYESASVGALETVMKKDGFVDLPFSQMRLTSEQQVPVAEREFQKARCGLLQ